MTRKTRRKFSRVGYSFPPAKIVTRLTDSAALERSDRRGRIASATAWGHSGRHLYPHDDFLLHLQVSKLTESAHAKLITTARN